MVSWLHACYFWGFDSWATSFKNRATTAGIAGWAGFLDDTLIWQTVVFPFSRLALSFLFTLWSSFDYIFVNVSIESIYNVHHVWLQAGFMQREFSGKIIHAAIYINERAVAGGLADGTNAWDQTSIRAIVHVTAGQKVALKNNSLFAVNFHGYEYTTFSGFLIKAD